MKRKSVFTVVLVIAMIAAMFAGCQPKTDDPGAAMNEPVKVGFIGPLTGPVAQYGINVRNGVAMYIEELNANGGVLGREVVLVEYDDEGDAMKALTGLSKLVEQDGVVAIFGSVTSAPTDAIASETAGWVHPVPIITASATAESITLYGNNVFRSCFIDPFQGVTMANFANEVLGAKTAAIIYNNTTDYSVGLMESFTARCEELNIEVVASESYGADNVDFRAQLTTIQPTNPDVLFVPDYYAEASLIAAQASELGFSVPMLGADGWSGVIEASTDPATLEGFYFSNHAANDDPEIKSFADSYQEKFGDSPLGFAATAYDAAKIMFAAIEAVESTDADAVVAALDATNLKCLTGTFTFDEFNNPIKDAAIIKIVNGEYVFDRKQ